MDASAFIFLAGSAASFLPIYRLVEKFAASRFARRRLHAGHKIDAANPAGFLELLRREAGARAALALRDAHSEACRALAAYGPGHERLRAPTLLRLEEASRMLHTVFRGDVTAQFDTVCRRLPTMQLQDAAPLSTAIGAVAARLAPPPRSKANGSSRRLRFTALAGLLFNRRPALA